MGRLDTVLGVRPLDLPAAEVDRLRDERVVLVVVERDVGAARRVRVVEFVLRVGQVGTDALRAALPLDVLAGGQQLPVQRDLFDPLGLVVGQRVTAGALVALGRGPLDDTGLDGRPPVPVPPARPAAAQAARTRTRPRRARKGDPDHHGRPGHRDGGTRHHLSQMAVHDGAHFPLLPLFLQE